MSDDDKANSTSIPRISNKEEGDVICMSRRGMRNEGHAVI